jgi:DNA-binding LacI/PurR family transcriptional regulator
MAAIGIKDVAALAGVSPSTVSRVLRGVSAKPDVERRVRDAVERLGYQPNGVAQALRGGQLGVLGLLIPDVSNPWLAELSRAIEGACRERGLGLLLCNSDNRAEQELGCLDLLWNRRVDGVILGSVRGQAPRSLLERAAAGWPVVALDQAFVGLGVDTVASDNEGGSRALAEHLIRDHGYERVALIDATPGLVSAQQRRNALESTLREHQRELVAVSVGDFTFESGVRGIEEILREAPDVQVVVASNDHMALGALQGAQRMGLRVPADLAITGFDDMTISSWAAVSLTTVRQDLDGLADAAVELLTTRAESPDVSSRHRTIPTSATIRESCGCRSGVLPA